MKNYLEDIFLNPPDQEIVVDGIKITPRTFRNFFIEADGVKKFVKKLSTEDLHRSFLIFKKIPKVEFLTDGHTFVLDKHIYRVTDFDHSLSSADLSCFPELMNIYSYSDRVRFVRRNFSDIHYFISETSHTLAPVYGTSLGDIAFKMLDGKNIRLEGCRKGFFHGDFHFGNILKNDKGLHIIDFTDVKYSYVAFNFAQCFLIEVIDKIDAIGIEKISEIRKFIMSKLDKSDAYYFDFFVSVMAYHWYIRMIPNLFSDIKLRKSHFISQLEVTLNILFSLQDGTVFPILGSNYIKDGKIVIQVEQTPAVSGSLP